MLKDIRKNTRCKFPPEENIRIVPDELYGGSSIAELRCREGIKRNLNYRWSKDLLETRKKRVSGNTFVKPS